MLNKAAGDVEQQVFHFLHPGSYNPCVSPAEIKIDAERAQEWIKTGAQPTDTVRALLKKVNAL